MAQQINVSEQLKQRFSAPLPECARRRIVVWHDPDGSFEADFEALAESGFAGLEREVSFVKAVEGAYFALKHRIYRDEAEADFLVYSSGHKDLSEHGLEGNWLADIELIAEHFQADYVSMLMDELGATDSAVEAIEQFKQFFNAQERKEKFKRLMPAAQTKQDVTLGVIGALLGASELTVECLTRTYLCSLWEGVDPLGTLGKYGADAAFSSFAMKRLGYAGDLSSLDDFSAHVLLTAVSFQLPEGSLPNLEQRVSLPHGQFCLNIVRDWMNQEQVADVLYEIARKVEQLCNLPLLLSQVDVPALSDADVFPCLNECILTNLFQSLSHGADRADEVTKIVQHRKDLRWFGRVEPYFDALVAAAAAQKFYRGHLNGFHYAQPVDVWQAYTKDWYAMDTCYRSFCKAMDSCHKTTSDLPTTLDDSLEALASWMERIYVNWFLAESNACWINASEESWFQVGYIEGVPRQRHFFEDSVVAGSADVKKTLVIISDALRFEVAVELAQRLEQNTRGVTEVKSMQSVFPSITEFGMAALLPHKDMSLSWNDGGVYLDDGLPTASTVDREAALRRRKPNSRCVQSKDFINAKRAARKELIGDAEFVYMYHNAIDSVGEEYSTEHKVFDACDEAIEDIVALVKAATGDLAFSRVVIASDHGFLYTREPLEEREKVSKKDISGSAVKLGRRYAIAEGQWADDSLFVKINMEDLEGGDYYGLAPRDCVRIKKPGPGDNYVHGGVSLQECCVPVIQYRYKRAGARGYEEHQGATVQLLSTTRRITSMLFRIEVFQKEAVGGKILPAEYELVLTDAAGNEVSDPRRVHADMTTPDEKARVANVQLSLKAGKQYDSKAPYFLVCSDKATGQIAWKEQYQVDMAFALDDFGF